ncbi:MAG: AMIN domain-containing protein [Blastocatellia bacterium]
MGLILLLMLSGHPALAVASYPNLNFGRTPRPMAAGNSAGQPGRLPPARRVLAVWAETADNGVRLVVKADGAMEFKPFTLSAPWRIVIDITGVRSAVGNSTIPVTSAVVDRIRIGQPDANLVRVVLDMPALRPYRVDIDGDHLLISVGHFNPTPSATNPPPSAAAPKPVTATVKTKAEEFQTAAPVIPTSPGAAAEQRQGRDNNAEDRATVSRLLRHVEELEARVRELEAKAPAALTASAAPATENVAAATNPPQSESHDIPDAHSNHDRPGGKPSLQLQGFADIDYRATNEHGVNNAFALGQLDLFLTSRLSDKFNVLGELIIQAGHDNAFSFEIHRLLLQYYPNDYFNLSVGRYHTGIGYYNSAYHHGQWFQTAATRPFIFAFEGQGGILPLHNVGVSLSGRIPSGSFGLRYLAEVGNGRSANSPADRSVQTTNDENQGKSVNFGLLMRPDWARGLQAGVSVYRDRLTPAGRADVDQTITAAHVIFRNSSYEWLNEMLLLHHSPLGSPRAYNSPAFYTQFARRFGDVWPYFRYEYLNVPDDDPIYPTIGRRNGPVAGLRFDLTEFVAFKVQYNHTQRRRLKSLDELLLQLAFTF